MTKREIRASVVSRIAPAKNACIYDIGAGTGSVTVELAMQALHGCVYAVERTEEGCSLIAQNAHKFGLDNIQVVHGSAAGVLEELPAPDAVFVGGSGGELEDIFKIILKKNPHVRIVITAVTLETVQEAVRLLEQNGFDTPQIVQIAVTEVKKRGQYHMLSANNPVFIIEGSVSDEPDNDCGNRKRERKDNDCLRIMPVHKRYRTDTDRLKMRSGLYRCDVSFACVKNAYRQFRQPGFVIKQRIRTLLAKKEKSSDITVIEGVMGYYDGAGFSTKGSSFEIAQNTDTPVILIVTAVVSAILSGQC